MLLWHNEEAVLKGQPLHDSQHGFRKGRSVDSALTCVVGRIEQASIRRSEGFAMAVFLDIQGAYDNLTNGAIVRALKRRKCSNDYIKWILDFLKFRKIVTNYKGVTKVTYPTKGAPQGAISSPYLWNEGYESFMEIFDKDKNVFVECYADDAVLIACGKSLIELQVTLQRAIHSGL